MNFITDIIIPLVSAFIGGSMALWGVHLTLERDKLERKLEREENSRPFFCPLDLLDSSLATSNNHIFCFSLTDCFDKSSPFLNAYMVNSEKVEFIIDKITICG